MNLSEKEIIAFESEKLALEREMGITAPNAYKLQSIHYIDPAPKPFVVQIPFLDYFRRVKRLEPYTWQVDFAARLESAAVNQHIHQTWAEIHCEAQLGKTSMLSQSYIAWLLAHSPLYRAALAMYNVSRAQTHSQVIIQIMTDKTHRDIFPNKDGWIEDSVSKAGWMTRARRELNDGQLSLNPMGLQSGFTGSGADALFCDDVYREAREAFSEQVRLNMANFWEYTVMSRVSPYTNVFTMFHRYAADDFGGYLLDTGRFDYWRYATIADGPYIHEETGQKFEDPLGRADGEYICPEKRPPAYYDQVRKNNRVWLSMFQGRPAAETGDFFQVGRIQIIEDPVQAQIEWQRCVLKGRGWDTAVTKDAGDYSAGALIGLQPNGDVVVSDMLLVQLDSESRIALQRSTAEEDGPDVTVVIPEEIGPGAKDSVFLMRQRLQGFNVVARKVTSADPGSTPKARRAHNLSVAVNSGGVKFLLGEWNKTTLRAMRNFLYSSFDDPIDALADVYNHLYEELHKGLVIKSQPRYQPPEIIPIHWTIYIGIKISADSTLPNCGVIVARAAENSGLSDTLYILGEYKEYTSDYAGLFDWIDQSLADHIAPPHNGDKPSAPVIWIHPDSEEYATTIKRKLKYPVRVFDQGDAGIVEANWYVQNDKLIGLGDLPNIKQEAATWGFNDKGEPNGIGQVWDCLRMITFAFRTRMVLMHPDDRRELTIASHFRLDTINAEKDSISEEEYGRRLLTRQSRLVTKKLFNPKKKTADRMSKFKR